MAEGGWVGEEDVDEKTAEGEGNAEAQIAETAVYLDWCDNANNIESVTAHQGYARGIRVIVVVPKGDVQLESGQVGCKV